MIIECQQYFLQEKLISEENSTERSQLGPNLSHHLKIRKFIIFLRMFSVSWKSMMWYSQKEIDLNTKSKE